MRIIKGYIKGVIWFVVILFVGTLVMTVGVEKWETHECYSWIEQSHEFVGYEFTDWQVEQCQSYGIDVNK